MIPKDVNLDYFNAALRRRFWYAVVPFFVVLMGAIVYCIIAPRVYVSTALILIQPQEVPADYIKSTVTTDVQTRLNSITEQVMSRSRLEQIITKYDLYSEARKKFGMFQAVEAMRKDVGITLKDELKSRRWNEGPSAFEVSFEGGEPQKIRDVAAEIANLYIDYNFKLRAGQAAGTTDFLERELVRMKDVLREKEEAVRQFKEKYLGVLPEQAESNYRILTQLQQHLDSVNTGIQKAEDRKVLLQTQLNKLQAIQTEGSSGSARVEDSLSPDQLRERLRTLQARYSDQHPDVIRLKALIAKAEKGEQPGSTETGTAASGGDNTAKLMRVQSEEGSTELKVVEREILALRGDREKTRAQIDSYKQRIETGPKIEQMFVDLRRDYEQASKNYQSLLQKKLDAEIAENMERTQKGEQFKILDQANLPHKPSKPNIPKMLLIGLVGALGCGLGLAAFLEYRDPAFWTRKELESVLEVPILVTLPVIQTEQDLRGRKTRRMAAVCLLFFMGSALLVALFVLWKTSPGLISLSL